VRRDAQCRPPNADIFSVKSKKKNDEWMSFSEFTYPILQAWDWWHMYNTMGIRMQIGGSDQYGNIAAGVHAVKYIAEHHPAPETPKKTTDSPFGLTAPLLTTSAGAKFGKSAGNAIWLDNALTSTFDFYSHFLRTSDADVGDYLKRFTFMPIEQIDTLVEEHMKSPSERKAQHKLAIELVELVHGKHEALDLMKQRSLIFKSPIQPYFGDKSSAQSAAGETTLDVSGASALDLAQVNVNNRPRAQMKLPRSLVETKSIGKVLFAAGLAESKSEGHRLAQNQAVYIGGAPTKHKQAMNEAAVSFAAVKAWKPEDIKTYLIHDKLLMLRRGKHNIRIIEIVEDEEYEKSGLTYPGKDTDDITKKMLESQQKKGKDLSGKLVDAKDLYAKEFENNVMVEWKASADEKDEDKEVEVVEWQRPEERITQLMYDLKRELEVRKSKLDEKNAPKPKFTGHSRPSNRASHHRSRGSARLREEGPYLEKKWIGGRHQLEWREHGQ
jgi:tyrosyl-tRNA synthetase